MLSNIKKYEKMSIATSIILIIFSLFLIFNPEKSLNFIVILLGAILALIGIVNIVSYFTSDRETRTINTEIVQGILYTVIGLFLIFDPSILNQFLGIIIGSWLIIQFVIKMQFALNLKSMASSSWPFMIISAGANLFFGILVLVNPFASVAALTTICGIILLISEVSSIVESIYLLSACNK